MKLSHIGLALLVAAIWGFNFVVIHVGLASFPPLLMVALRFALAALPIFIVPRPKIPWRHFLALGFLLFLAQFALLFTAMAHGMPAGVASMTIQLQALFTMALAALFLGERPSSAQILGMPLAFAGLALIASTAGSDVSWLGLALTIAAAMSWAGGNILLRKLQGVDMLHLAIWLSIIPPLPLLALSVAVEGPHAITQAMRDIDWMGAGAVVYLALFATIIGYGIWGNLFKLYPAATVAPFALAVPVFGATSSALLLGERFGTARMLGMMLVFAGLAVVALVGRRPVRTRAES